MCGRVQDLTARLFNFANGSQRQVFPRVPRHMWTTRSFNRLTSAAAQPGRLEVSPIKDFESQEKSVTRPGNGLFCVQFGGEEEEVLKTEMKWGVVWNQLVLKSPLHVVLPIELVSVILTC